MEFAHANAVGIFFFVRTLFLMKPFSLKHILALLIERQLLESMSFRLKINLLRADDLTSQLDSVITG
jgi:hypothetical protein